MLNHGGRNASFQKGLVDVITTAKEDHAMGETNDYRQDIP